MSESRLQAVKGMNDVLPPESAKWQHLEAHARRLLEAYGYQEVRTPLVEPTQLFARAIGAATDIVEKEMYTFPDGKPGEGEQKLITLRPEGTAGAVRALLEHGAATHDPTARWYYSGPMFRRERPQKGRYRQFYQIGAEAFGVAEPTVDAEMIGMLVALFETLGISDVDVLVNSVGGEADRPAYRAALLGYLEQPGPDGRPRKDGLCENCRRRMVTNPLRILDCKVPGDVEVAAGAPSILGSLSEPSRAHFDAVCAGLGALGVKHSIDPRLVRGLDYYTGTVFEVRGRGPGLGSQNALCGGGRYDKLVEQLGGAATPAVGFAFGVERVIATMPGEAASYQRGPELALVSHGDAARKFCLVLAHKLRAGGARVDLDHRAVSLKAQLKRADRIGARLCGVVGEAELAAGTVMLRDMKKGDQRPVSCDELAAMLRSPMRDAHVSTGKGKLAQGIELGPHHLIADEQVPDGGDDTGPQPHEFLLAALGACTSITLKVYAARKGFPLERVNVVVSLVKVDGVSEFRRHITLHGPLDADQKKRLHEIADKCPVHKTLTGQIKIATDLAE